MSGRTMPLLRDRGTPPTNDHARDEAAALEQKCEWILKREWAFAHRVALRLVDKPELSVWMILIPIIFLHFMHRAQKFKTGLGAVTRELFVSREFALMLARESVTAGTEAPDPAERFPTGGDTAMSRQLRAAELHLARILIEHYRKLLQARGGSYAELVRDAYGDEDGYRGFLARLATADGNITACARQVAEDIQEADQTITLMDSARRELREEDVQLCFPPPQSAP